MRWSVCDQGAEQNLCVSGPRGDCRPRDCMAVSLSIRRNVWVSLAEHLVMVKFVHGAPTLHSVLYLCGFIYSQLNKQTNFLAPSLS